MRPQAMRVCSARGACRLEAGKFTCNYSARDLFTCELHVKLPAFAGNFARASFTVIFRSQTTQNSGPEISHDMVTIVQKESLCGHGSFQIKSSTYRRGITQKHPYFNTYKH